MILLALCAFVITTPLSAQLVGHWESRSPMPVSRANMATASMEIGDTTWIYTFMGIDSTKACGSGIKLESYKYNTVSDVWTQIASVPDSEGRIAASAHGINGKVYLIGGYKVFSGCSEFTSPRVDIYDPATDSWSLGDSVPTPTDDHVQVNFKDSLLILVSGWSQNTNIRNVQVYDTYLDTWSQSNLIPGVGLFGHCGGLINDSLLYYLDGVRISGFNFVLINQFVEGVIDPTNLGVISWSLIGQHPGDRVYRGGGIGYGDRLIITGGTNNAYNIDGIGYNNQPSVESGRTFGYHPATGNWEEYAHNPDSVMDVRQLVPVGSDRFYVVGGMEASQTVTNKVSVFVVDTVTVGRVSPMPLDFELRLRLSHAGQDHRIELTKEQIGRIELEIFDLNARQIGKRVVEVNGTSHIILSEWLPGLGAGAYVLTARSGETLKALKFVVWE